MPTLAVGMNVCVPAYCSCPRQAWAWYPAPYSILRTPYSVLEHSVLFPLPSPLSSLLSPQCRLSINYQKSAAEHAVHRLIGVLGVTNNIEVKPPAEAYEVREKIEKALSRVAPFDAQKISIRTGRWKSHSRWQCQQLVRTRSCRDGGWSAPGVTQVQDNIALTW